MRSYDYECPRCKCKITNEELSETCGECPQCTYLVSPLFLPSHKIRCNNCKQIWDREDVEEGGGRCAVCGRTLIDRPPAPKPVIDDEDDGEEPMMCDFCHKAPAVKLDDYGMGYCERCGDTLYYSTNDLFLPKAMSCFRLKKATPNVVLAYDAKNRDYYTGEEPTPEMQILLEEDWTLGDMIQLLTKQYQDNRGKIGDILNNMSDQDPITFERLMREGGMVK